MLIVEDEAGIRLALRGLLRREGYEVEQRRARARTRCARLRAEPFDLVLTDLALGDGPERHGRAARARKEPRPRRRS